MREEVDRKTKKTIKQGNNGGSGGDVYFISKENFDNNLSMYSGKFYKGSNGRNGYKKY